MTYVKQSWANGAAGGTPLSADRLAHIEAGLAAASSLPFYPIVAQPSWVANAPSNSTAFNEAISAAVADGGGAVVLPFRINISSRIVVPQGVNVIGGGGGKTGAASTIICTTTDSCLAFGDQTAARNGGLSGYFNIDGNSIATNPFYIGLDVGRVFINIDIKGATDVAQLLAGSQNNVFIQVNCEDSRDGIRVDLTASTNSFVKCEYNNCTRYIGSIVQTGPTPSLLGGSGVPPINNSWDNCIFERGPSSLVACFYQGAGSDNVLSGCVFAPDVAGTGALVKTDKLTSFPSVSLRLHRCSLNGNNLLPTGINFGNNTSIYLSGFTSIYGVATAVATGAATAGVIYDDGSTNYAGTTNKTTGVNAESILKWVSATALYVSRPLAAYSVFASTVAGDSGYRFFIDGNGAMQFGDGTAGPDVILLRGGANILAIGTDDVFRTGKNTTGSRPNAVSATEGGLFYDTTLHKPIWSDGTNWRDATGSVV